MNRLFKFAGILTCAVALGLNIQWAVDGYGIKDGKVHVEILAQTTGGTGTGTGSGTGGGTGYEKIKKTSTPTGERKCIGYELFEKYNVEITCPGKGDIVCTPLTGAYEWPKIGTCK